MSEEEDGSLNIQRSWKRARVKHSTPAEVLTPPQNALGLSPVPQKAPRSALEVPTKSRVRSSTRRLQRPLSVVSNPSQELSSDSWFSFLPRRLSTITDFEESPETLHRTITLPETSGGKTRDSGRSQRRSQKGVIEQEAQRPERPASRASGKTERHLQKQLVERRVRAWELRQLIDIEEAVTHELFIEEVRAWK